jgi:hypothetical protein
LTLDVTNYAHINLSALTALTALTLAVPSNATLDIVGLGVLTQLTSLSLCGPVRLMQQQAVDKEALLRLPILRELKIAIRHPQTSIRGGGCL